MSFGGRLFLNWSNRQVRREMYKTLAFWLNLGVDGFYLKNIHSIQTKNSNDLFQLLDEIRNLLEREDSDDQGQERNEPLPLRSSYETQSTSASGQTHTKSSSNSRPSSSKYTNKRAGKRVLIAGRPSLERLTERTRVLVHHTSQLTPSNTSSATSKAHFLDVFRYFDLIDTFLEINMSSTESLRDQVNSVYLNEPGSHPWTLWNIGSATSSRLATRIGPEFTAAATFLLIMLPGSVSIFYGDELGLKDSIDGNSNKVSTLRTWQRRVDNLGLLFEHWF